MKSVFSKIVVLGAAAAFLAGCAGESFMKTADGVSIAYERHQVAGSAKTAILVHGLGSDMREWYNFEKALRKDGWSTFAFDIRGHGSSTEWKEGSLDWHEFTPQAARTAVQDVRSAMETAGGKAVWLVGSSFGSNLSLSYAAGDPKVKGVVLLTPGINYLGVESEPALRKYSGRPLLIAASKDEPGAEKVAQWLYDSAGEPKKLILNDQGGHGSEMLEFNPQLQKDIIEWMDQHTA